VSDESDEPSIILPGDAAAAGGAEMFDALLGHFGGAGAAEGIDPKIVRTLRAEFDRSEFFGRDMRRLWAMLDTVVAKSGRTPGAGRDSFDLLNLACGYCQEGAVLSAFWGRGGARVRQFAMDLRDAEIDKAKRRYAATERLFRAAGLPSVRQQDGGAEVEFVAGDASKLAGVGQIPSQFDVVFIRHQNLWHDRPTWQRIYEFALSRIADEGLLIITSYFDREHVLALELLRALDGEVLVSEQNPDSRELPTEGKSIDRHVAAIARR
jgi:SAM-dependent methyltransferase